MPRYLDARGELREDDRRASPRESLRTQIDSVGGSMKSTKAEKHTNMSSSATAARFHSVGLRRTFSGPRSKVATRRRSLPFTSPKRREPWSSPHSCRTSGSLRKRELPRCTSWDGGRADTYTRPSCSMTTFLLRPR